MSKPMRVLIVGAGNMANYHAEAYLAAGAELAGAVDVREDNLAAFCAKHGVAQSFGSVADALAWGEFDSASVVTPDAMHKDASLPLLAAGKHVLCEKPLAPNHADARAMADAAAAAGTVAMVHLTYRVSAALGAAHALVKAGRLGALKHVQAELPPELAGAGQLGRLAHAGHLAVAAVDRARLARRPRRRRRPPAGLRLLRGQRPRRRCPLPAADLRQGRGRPHRRGTRWTRTTPRC